MNDLPVRSPASKVAGIVHFGRMLDKIKAHAHQQLPDDYVRNLGKGFDARCVAFLQVEYGRLIARVAEGGSDEQILEWCFRNGREPKFDEIHIWNEFMRKCGWNDDITETLAKRKKEGGFAERSDLETMFQFIDADEGRP